MTVDKSDLIAELEQKLAKAKEEQKEFDISNGFRAGYSIERLATEIAKCDVRCANCHMRKTARDFNWYTFKHLQNCSQV